MVLAPKRYILSSLFLFFSVSTLFAQNKVIKTYYDKEKKQIKEEYRVSDKDSSVLDGLYKTFYQNGRIKTVGFYTQNQASDYWEYFYQNGNLKMEGLIQNFLNEGHWIYYYENGHKSHEGQMEKGKKNGFWRYYYEDGALKSEGDFIDNIVNGTWKYYYDDGSLKAVATYKKGVGYYTEFYPSGSKKSMGKIIHGKSDSTWVYYYPNGNIKAVGNEKDGLKDGQWRFYYENGQPSSIGTYTKGNTNGFWRYFHENGVVSSEGMEKDGQREGQWKMFYNTGKPKGEGNFNKGDGAYTEYYDNGKPKLKGYFKKGIYDGLWEYFYEDGRKEGDCNYINGEGWYTGYYPDGNKKMEGLLNNGNKIGVWKLYKPDGTIAGYYRTYYEENDATLVKNDSLVPAKKEIPKTPAVKKKPQKSKPFKLKLYRLDPLIYKTFILSFEPINMLIFGSLPVHLEYYVQEKWGFEATLTYHRKPFFALHSNLDLGTIYTNGASFGVGYKRYFYNPDFVGLPYVGMKARVRTLEHAYNKFDSVAVKEETFSLSETNYELNFVVGDRFMKYFDQSGITVDVYFGIGLGYRRMVRNYMQGSLPDQSFGSLLAQPRPLYFPIIFGFSLGYAF